VGEKVGEKIKELQEREGGRGEGDRERKKPDWRTKSRMERRKEINKG
jgi:hypothetical protein